MKKHLNPLIKIIRLTLLLMVLGSMSPAYSQFDSIQVSTGFLLSTASKNYQPFWNTMKRYGTVSDLQTDLSLYLRAKNQHVLAQTSDLEEGAMVSYTSFVFEYGVSAYSNTQFKNNFLEEAYGRFAYKNFALTGGRFEEILGGVDRELSSGSLGISGNSIPIPKVSLAITDFTDLPFASGLVSIKGSIAHGWLGSNRFMKKSMYHEKSLFLRFGSGSLKIYGGFQHFAEWGGSREGISGLDNSFNGWWNVASFKSSARKPLGSIETVSDGSGDQRSVLEVGGYYDDEFFSYQAYAQVPVESGDELRLKNKSVLLGVSLKPKDEELNLRNVVVEVLYTKEMNWFVKSRPRQSYYNNEFYRTGWEYEDRVIGTPLFLNRQRANKYFEEIQPINWDTTNAGIPENANIVNNRLFGFHVGASYDLGLLKGKVFLTYTVNYGNLDPNTPFAPNMTQVYTLNEFSYEVPAYNLNLKVGLGIDFGELSGNVGGLFGLEWRIPVGKYKPGFETF